MNGYNAIIIIFISLGTFVIKAQDTPDNTFVDISYFYGNIARHNNDIAHLINGHPEGVIIGWNKKTFGFNAWERDFNYPDYGLSFSYQNLKDTSLGQNYALYAHYNFYFFKRNVMLRIGQGLAYTTNPYDKEENFRNIAFGSHVMSSTYLMLNYKKENIVDNLGFQAGLSLIHYSNANVKAPNTSINSIAFNIGLNYQLERHSIPYQDIAITEEHPKAVNYTMVFRTGINESDVVGSGQFPFYIFSFYANKRLGRKSGVHLGTEVFFSNFLKEYIRYRSTALLENDPIQGDEDYKRAGIFAGHELFINKLSVVTQLGYYVYYPVDFEGRVYFRVGLKRYFGKKFFGALTLKSHAAKAEAVEFGIGLQL